MTIVTNWDRSALPDIPGGIAGFQEAIGASYFPYEVESAEGGATFHGAGTSGRMGPLLLSRIYASAAFSGFRAPREFGDQRHSYILLLKEFGGDVHFHNKRSCTIHTGEILLIDSKSALETRQYASGSSLSVSIPTRLLASRYANVDDWCLVPLDTSTGAAAVLRECMLCYWRSCEQVNALETDDLAAGLIHLIGAAFKSHGQLPAFESRSLKMHFLRIRQVVSEHLEDADLSADFVAHRLGLSKSYIYEIMSSVGLTLGRFILTARLDRSRELLADPAMAERYISDIAFSVGFQDLSHFSRRFNERFHCSPRDFRTAMLGAKP
jgi:AraC-like DNA-binding protein